MSCIWLQCITIKCGTPPLFSQLKFLDSAQIVSENLFFKNVFHRNQPTTHQDTEHVLYLDHETAINKYSVTPRHSPLNHAQYQHVVKRLYFTSSDRLAGRLHTKSCIQLNSRGVLCRTCLYDTAFLLDQCMFCNDKTVSFYMRLTGLRSSGSDTADTHEWSVFHPQPQGMFCNFVFSAL